MSGVNSPVVNMRFNGTEFLNGLNNAQATFGAFKKELNLDQAKAGLEEIDGAAKRFSLEGMKQGVEGLSAKFVSLATVGITALSNITNKAVEAGVSIVKSLTIEPIMQGFQEYETGLNSVQTILANTAHEGKNLDDVNAALSELNQYSDQTIYNFGEMSRNIGTFTAAGVGLETSTAAIKGIANLAAVSGSNSQQASSAMYQLSQALAAGKVSLMDWNSVVYAGMGGKVFQDSLMSTARASGVAIDEIISRNGTFRESLQEGWLTSDILTKTLAKFTGDMSAADLANQGYTEAEIAEILKMAETAKDAATKVKTLSQLMGTLKETAGSGWAQTWQILLGDFEEAKELFTWLSDRLGTIIGQSNDMRNNLLQAWKDLGGRKAAVEAIKAAFVGIMSVIDPIREAFAEIFPAPTAQALLDLTVGIRDFLEGIILTETEMENLKRTFKGIFAVLDIVRFAVSALWSIFVNFFSALTKGDSSILAITGNFGDFLVSIRDAIVYSNGLNDAIEKMGNFASILGSGIQAVLGVFAIFVGWLKDIASVGADKALENVSDKIAGLSSVTGFLGKVVGWVGDGLKSFFAFASPAIDRVVEAFSGLGPAIAKGFEGLDFGMVLDSINTGLFAGLVLMIKNFMGGGLDFDLTGGFLESMKEAFGGLTETLSAMQANLQAGTLMKIAIAVGVLALSLAVLAMIDPVRLTSALMAISVMFGQLIGSLALFLKVTKGATITHIPVIAASLILLALAMVILAAAVAILAKLSWEELLKGMLGLAAMLGMMVGAVKLLQKNTAGIAALSFSLILFGIAVNILVKAVTTLAGMTWDQLIQGLVGLGATMLLIIGFIKAMGNPGKLIPMAAGLVLVGMAMNLMASAVSTFAAMSMDQLVTGLIGLGGALLILVAAMQAMPKNFLVSAAGMIVLGIAINIIAGALASLGSMSWDQLLVSLVGLGGALAMLVIAMNLMSGSMSGMAALILAAAAMYIIANALTMMAAIDWGGVGRAMVLLFGSLAMLALAMYAMTGAIVGAAALMIASVAILILANALTTLGSMSWDQVLVGLVTLAASLAILGLAAWAMTPILPQLLLLGVAVLLLGAGAMMAGVGIGLLAIGLTMLAGAGTAAGTAIVVIITALLGLIPQIFEAIGNGIIAMAGVIEKGAPAIVAAIMAILMSLITALQELIPALVDLIITIVMKLVDVLVTNIPLLVEAGINLIAGIIQGIADSIGGVISAATDLIVNFINGISEGLPRIIQAGIDMIINFINGLANGIRDNTARMNEAGANLADAIVSGMTSGITNGAGAIIQAAKDAALGALNAAKSALGIKSPSREFRKVGDWSMQGFAGGIDDNADKVQSSADGVAEGTLDAFRSAMNAVDDILDETMDKDPTIRPTLDLSQVENASKGYSSLFSDPTITPNAAYNNVNAISSSRSSVKEPVEDTTSSGNTYYNFTQNNTSPKALSPVDIYRQTKNQFSLLKGKTNVAQPNALV